MSKKMEPLPETELEPLPETELEPLPKAELEPLPKAELKVMTWNLRDKKREQNKRDEWEQRRDAVTDQILRYRPTIVLLQELSNPAIHKDLTRLLVGKGYRWIQESTQLCKWSGSSVHILYDSRHLKELCSHTHAVNPDRCGEGKYCRALRVATFELINARGEPGRIYAMCTHLVHDSATQRYQGARRIAKVVATFDDHCAIVLGGDMNCKKKGKEKSTYEMLTKRMLDSVRHTPNLKRKITQKTVNHFEDKKPKWADTSADHIDWLLHRSGTSLPIGPIESKVIAKKKKDGGWPSDHHAIITTFKLLKKYEGNDAKENSNRKT